MRAQNRHPYVAETYHTEHLQSRICRQVSSGSFWDVPLTADGPAEVGFIVHIGDDKTAGGSVATIDEVQQEVWLVDGCQAPFLSEKEASLQAIGSLASASAHWCEPIRAPVSLPRAVHGT